MKYIQLCTTTTYEIGHSIIKAEDYAKRAKDLGYDSIAVSDNNIRAYPSFEYACKKYGLLPLFGYRMQLASSIKTPFHAFLYIKNETGYKNLCKLISLKEDIIGTALLKQYHEGLILVIQADTEFYYQDYFLTKISPDIFAYHKIFQDDFALGITLRNKEDREDSPVLYKYCQDNSYPIIPLPEVHYLTKQDYSSYCLFQSGLKKEVYHENENESSDFLLSPNALKTIYREEDINTLSSLFGNIDFTFIKKRGKMIHIDNDDESLKQTAYEGLKNKGLDKNETYTKRLDYELSVIKDMHFSSYFLIVEDYVSFAKECKIKVGPGRGSAGGSLVSYSLGITDVNPIKYDLSFERFLNPKRKTMPDIDIDFEDTRRNEIVHYLENKYGEEKVGTIRTFVCLKPKSALNLIGPALSVPDNRIKKISSLIPDTASTFEEVRKDTTWKGNKFRELMKDDYFRSIVDKAESLLGLVVNTSFHAPGVIISEDNISTYCPRENGDYGTIEFEYPYMEQMGYLKVDILPLSTLSFIKSIEERIMKSGSSLIDIQNNLNDKETFLLLNKLHLGAIFQLDATLGMKEVVKLIKPQSFSDIPAILALYRPGPKDYIPLYAKRKNGLIKTEYPDERLKDILSETYGIMVYQEQVIKAVQVIASFSASDADLFRRAISKKDITKMEMYKEQFVKGCLNNGIDGSKAEKLYLDIEKFANYGFNKSHAYSYAFITYQLLYYKAHYPKEFYASAFKLHSLSSATGLGLVKELKDDGYHLHVPDISLSLKDDILFHDDFIYLPLGFIAGVDSKTIQFLMEEREKRPFTSFYDIIQRLIEKDSNIDKRTLFSLIDSGALDSLEKNRAGMEKHLEQYIDFAKMAFDESLLPSVDDIKEKQGQKLLGEKSKLSLIISKKISSIAKKQGYSSFLISDVSRYELDSTLTIDNESKSYQIAVNKKENYKKGDILLVQAEDYYKSKKRIYPIDTILYKEN